MKRLSLILLVAVVTCACYAQRIKVHQGNNINSYLLSAVDSITIHRNELLRVYYNTLFSEFSVNNVDSVSVNPEIIDSYNIVSEQLNGWDEGLFNKSNNEDDFYIVSKTDSDEDGVESVTFCINILGNEDPNKTVIFRFNKDGDLQEIITSGYQFKAQKYLNDFYFVVYKDGENVGNFSVPCEVVNSNESIANNSRRRLPFFNSKGKISLPKIKDFAGKAGGIMNKAGNAIGAGINLDEGKYADILVDLALSGLISLADLPFAAAIIAEEGIKGLLKHYYEQEKSRLIGDAEIEIKSIKRTSETAITVEGSISNVSSIPTTVYWGIAEGKSGQPGLYLNDNCTGIIPISNDVFSYTFFLQRVPGQVLYFRPFLAPEAQLPSEGEAPSVYTCIRYGERKEFIDVDVELSNFKQIKCVKENGKYKVQFTIDGSIPGLFQELSGWGFDVTTKTGSNEQRYFAKESDAYYPPLEKNFTCDITIEEGDLDEETTDIGNQRIAEITITPFVSFWNSMPPIVFLEEKSYTITINDGLCPDDNHPHAIDLGLPSGTKWCCCNVGASTPEGYGGYYAWGETSEKSEYTYENYKYYKDFHWIGDELIRGGYTKYSSDSNWGYNNFTDGKTELDSSDDAATVNMGASWRMPSVEQMKELFNMCSRQWTQQNGVNGILVTGPSGDQVFLPAAGCHWSGMLYNANCGLYWSSSIYMNYTWDQYSAYFFSFLNGYWGGAWEGLNEWPDSRTIGLSVRAVRVQN